MCGARWCPEALSNGDGLASIASLGRGRHCYPLLAEGLEVQTVFPSAAVREKERGGPPQAQCGFSLQAIESTSKFSLQSVWGGFCVVGMGRLVPGELGLSSPGT